ncbi:hypothetical protein [Rhizobium azibense]|uniref:hypothetical protein n=1 Tax=Rhizobium azibense TaxID=1136135 RepID=UPI00104FE959|nr:hypothetical protein [Rhizobium azibense]
MALRHDNNNRDQCAALVRQSSGSNDIEDRKVLAGQMAAGGMGERKRLREQRAAKRQNQAE